MRPTLRGEAMPMQRCEMRAAVTTWLRRVRAFRALGLWPCVAHLGSGAIRWLESDLRRKRPAKQQRGEHRPVASGRFFRRRPLGMVTRDKYSPHIFEPHILSLAPAFSKLPAPPSWRSPCRRLALPRLPVPTDAPCTNVGTMAYLGAFGLNRHWGRGSRFNCSMLRMIRHVPFGSGAARFGCVKRRVAASAV
jgi:hypothetical protein